MISLKQHWRTTYELNRERSNGYLKAWWDRYAQAGKYYEKHKAYQGISQNSSLSSWRTATIKKWKEGNLSAEQINALKEIDFPFHPLKSAPRSSTGSKISVIIKLKKSFDAGNDLTKEEQKKLQEGLKTYKKAYNNGSLSDSSARKLGIVLD